MRGLVQRVAEASVENETGERRAIGPGILLLVGVGPHDSEAEARWLAEKTANLRIFPDGEGRMNRSLLDTGGEALVISQFTLYGDATRGRRPSFVGAAPPGTAEPLYLRVAELLSGLGVSRVPTGFFGAAMRVGLVNEGPVTLLLESPGS